MGNTSRRRFIMHVTRGALGAGSVAILVACASQPAPETQRLTPTPSVPPHTTPVSPVASPPAARSWLDDVGALTEQIMQDWHVPGAAVAIVYQGNTVFLQGFGKRDVEHDLPVTPDTLFAIGSCTKAFTATALGMLVDEKKLAWDTPVQQYLPAFRMVDAWATAKLTPRDLLTHRSGLPAHTFAWYGVALPRTEVMKRLQYLAPNYDLRVMYQYQSMVYALAGNLIAAVTGDSWETFVQERILTPLQMSRTNLTVAESAADPNVALPYLPEPGAGTTEGGHQVPFINLEDVAPAGAINSSAADMVKWLQLQLSTGQVAGTPIVSSQQLEVTHTPQMVMQDLPSYPELPSLTSYGLGWEIQTYRGRKAVTHGGNISGFTANVTLLPEEQFGIAILTNYVYGPPDAMAWSIIDRFLGFEVADWSGRFLTQQTQAAASVQQARQADLAGRKPNAGPTQPIAEYAGTFFSPGYGTVGIAPGDNAALKMTFNSLNLTLTPYAPDVYDLFSAADGLSAKVTFNPDKQGRVNGLTASFEPTVAPINFVRWTPADMANWQRLEHFVGAYDLNGTSLVIYLGADSVLRAATPGNPDRLLQPAQADTFNVDGVSGASLAFHSDASGAVTAVELRVAGATALATRVSGVEA